MEYYISQLLIEEWLFEGTPKGDLIKKLKTQIYALVKKAREAKKVGNTLKAKNIGNKTILLQKKLRLALV